MQNLGQAYFTQTERDSYDPTWFGPWYIINSIDIAVIVSYNSIITCINTQYNNSKLQIWVLYNHCYSLELSDTAF